MDKTEIEGTVQERRLYDLIWKRTIASQMADAEIEKTTVNINISTSDEQFVAQGEVVKFDGFLKYTVSRLMMKSSRMSSHTYSHHSRRVRNSHAVRSRP